MLELWCRGLTCLPVTQEIAGSNPVSSANKLKFKYAVVAELADAQDSGSCGRKLVEVQVLSTAPKSHFFMGL